jgi:hypothetical protein
MQRPSLTDQRKSFRRQPCNQLSCQDSSSTKLISFPKMKELRLRNVRCITAMDLLHNVIRHCPALQRLSWHHMEHWIAIKHFVTVERFCELLEEGNMARIGLDFGHSEFEARNVRTTLTIDQTTTTPAIRLQQRDNSRNI